MQRAEQVKMDFYVNPAATTAYCFLRTCSFSIRSR